MDANNPSLNEPLAQNKSHVKQPKPHLKFAWMKYEFQIILALLIGSTLIGWYLFWGVNQDIISKGLIRGVIPSVWGTNKDNSDPQFRDWEANFHYMVAFAAIFLIGSRLIKCCTNTYENPTPALLWNLLTGFGYIFYLESVGMFYWLTFTLGNFILVKVLGKWKGYPLILWTTGCISLYYAQNYTGFNLDFISKEWTAMMKGAIERWFVLYNLSLLRIMSFCLDYHWALNGKAGHKLKQRAKITYRERVENYQPLETYNLFNYYSYLAYPPLFLTGPILTFNAYISQIYQPQTNLSRMDIFKYAIRFILAFIGFECFIRMFYCNATVGYTENIEVWTSLHPVWLVMIAVGQLLFIWWKFYLFWRFARLWSLLDGIEPVENMNRCVFNNYTFEGFWRSWHRSFNQWLIRYLFIPLGGSQYKFYNVWVVFSFVAFWHQPGNEDLMYWAWLICACLVPEMGIKSYFSHGARKRLWNRIWLRWAAAFLGLFTITFLIVSNQIGFGVGWEEFQQFLDQFNSKEGLMAIGIYCVYMMLLINVSFKIREIEEEKGEYRGF